MYILGLNAYHGDSSACIYQNGNLIVASEEERFRRVKHWAGLPTEAIKFCLEAAEITLKEVDVITVARHPLAKIEKKIMFAARKFLTFKGGFSDRVSNNLKFRTIKKDIAEHLGFQEEDIKAKVKYIEHHRSHIASSFFVSPFEEAAVISIDGMGDFTSTMRGIAKGNKIEIIDSVSFPHSIGYFYTTFTQWLGFPNYGDEYKVMGLSPYGKPNHVEQVKKTIKLKSNGLFELEGKYFKPFSEKLDMDWSGGYPHIASLFTEEFTKEFGPVRDKTQPLTQFHMDMAKSVQAVCEEVIFHMANDLQKKTGLKNLALSGGVGQNSVANGKLVEKTNFDHLFVPPAAHDAGTSVGAVLYYYHHDLKNPRSPFKNQPYTGSSFSNDEIEIYLKGRNIEYTKYSDEDLYEVVADRLIDSGVIGWFQGRAEFGPRALGNRSILVDPRRADAKELLNVKIKRRESFRPFAPSILKEFTGDYFERVDDVPFMEKVFKIKEEKRKVIPAVTHVDGTGRLQTVDAKDSPRYHKLISTFNGKTGVPILLNTSFNENEPIVNSPEHALECYLRTKMDMLIMGNIVVSR